MFTENLSALNNMILEELKDFSSETSIHGLGQVANERAPTLKRITWFAIFVASLAYAGQQLVSTIKGIILFSYFKSGTVGYQQSNLSTTKLHLKKRKLSTNSQRDYNSVLQIINNH